MSVPSYTFNLKRAVASQSRSVIASRANSSRILHIFMFLEEGSSKDCHTPNQRCQHYMRLVSALREKFDEFVTAHSKVFQKAVHSALDKLICNYGSQSKVKQTHKKFITHNLVYSETTLSCRL